MTDANDVPELTTGTLEYQVNQLSLANAQLESEIERLEGLLEIIDRTTDAERAEAKEKLTTALTFLDLACAQASATGHKRAFLAVCGGFEDCKSTQVAVLPNVHEFFTDIARVMGYATINDLLLVQDEDGYNPVLSPKAAADLEAGLESARTNGFHDIGSFAEFADEE